MTDEPPGDRPDEPPLDLVVPRAPTEDGKGVHVVRLRQEGVEVGELRPLEEGKAVAPSAEVLKLSPRDDLPAWNAEVIVPRRMRRALPAPADAPPRSGPAQVATDEYRRNWAATFGDDDELN